MLAMCQGFFRKLGQKLPKNKYAWRVRNNILNLNAMMDTWKVQDIFFVPEICDVNNFLDMRLKLSGLDLVVLQDIQCWKNEYLIGSFGCDTAENEISKVWPDTHLGPNKQPWKQIPGVEHNAPPNEKPYETDHWRDLPLCREQHKPCISTHDRACKDDTKKENVQS